MSRIGKKKIVVPEGVTVTVSNDTVYSRGPKGENTVSVPKGFSLKQEENVLSVVPPKKENSAIFGLFRSLVSNAVEGSDKGFEKKLEIKGVGYRAKIEGETLVLTVGYSHPVYYKQPKDIMFTVKTNTITVSGHDKQQVGEVTAQIRSIRPPDAYKGKGIRYHGEAVRLKPGKAVKTTTGGA